MTTDEFITERMESVPGCTCLLCRMYPVTQDEYNSLHSNDTDKEKENFKRILEKRAL